MFCELKDRALIKVSGTDVIKFLQGLLTNDITKLSEDNPIVYSCFLTPQGKFFADLFVITNNENLYIDISSARKTEIIRKLNMYKLRGNIEFESTMHKVVYTTHSKDLTNSIVNSFLFKDPRSPELGHRAYIDPYEFNFLFESEEEDQNFYEEKRIELLIPEGDKDLIPEKSFPLEYGLDRLNAIDFNKGCYLGQELISRTHYIGVIRKKIYFVSSSQSLPPLGHEIFADKVKLGIICSSCKNKGLALIRSEELEKLPVNAIITCNNIEIKITGL